MMYIRYETSTKGLNSEKKGEQTLYIVKQGRADIIYSETTQASSLKHKNDEIHCCISED